MNLLNARVTVVLPAALIAACAGYDRALLVTKTNIGLDVDTKPPTAEISIARREVAIQPTYPETVEQGDPKKAATATGAGASTKATVATMSKETALPLLASFGLQGNFLNPRITGHFAGGDAAVYLAQETVDNAKGGLDSSLCLKSEPKDTRSLFLKFWHFITNKSYEDYLREPRPFYFATDTTYGLKAAWSGTSGPYPDSLKLGYNRKEFASPPIFVDTSCGGNEKYWNIKLPSFYASIDNGSGWETVTHDNPSEPGVWKGHPKHIQFFATGQAANAFAKRLSVRQVAFENMAPEAGASEATNLNQCMIEEIKVSFDKADDSKQSAILSKAVELQLVPKADKATFFAILEANAKGINYAVSYKLNELRIVAEK